MICFDRTLFARTTHAPFWIGAGALALASGHASATWSVLIADTRTGEIVLGSATCVESINLQQETPLLITGIGAVTAQSAVDTTGMNRQLIRDRLLQGVPLDLILQELSMSDPGHDNRQYGMITAGGETLTYSGVQNAAWAGGITGRLERGVPGPQDDIVYAVQGNILSGSNVVQAAVDAIEASNGDLPQMLMEAMQAAKTGGGDGRCSCSAADPTGCGSPPPSPFKSAHVGYMLGGRAGDIDAIRAIYPIDGAVGALATIDLDGDGFAEVVAGNLNNDELYIYKNTAMEGDPLSSLQLWQTIHAPASGTRSMSASDSGLVIAFNDPPRLGLYQSDGAGSIEQLDTLDLAGTPSGIARGIGSSIAVGLQGVDQALDLDVSGGAFMSMGQLDLGFSPAGVVLAQVAGDADPELLVTDPSNNLVHVYAGGGEAYSIITSNDPVKVEAADMDNDGNNEIVVLCGAARRVEVYNLENDQWTLWGSASLFGAGIGLGVGDMSGDGFPDLVTTYAGTNRNMQLYISDGQGGFTMQSRTRAGSGAASIELKDMNNNGDLDIVVGNYGEEGLMILDNPRGLALPQPGRFADGEYFMSLNVPNQRADDPDPVDQLQALYDTWVAGREGRVDAVRSRVVGRGLIARNESSVLTIELRDLHGNLLGISDPAMLSLSSSEPIVGIGAPVLVEPGVFEVELLAGDETGSADLIVRAGDEGDPVQLMPALRLGVVESLADFNADGACDFYDVSRFIRAFLIEDPNADFDASGVWDFRDVSAFLVAYNQCAGG